MAFRAALCEDESAVHPRIVGVFVNALLALRTCEVAVMTLVMCRVLGSQGIRSTLAQLPEGSIRDRKVFPRLGNSSRIDHMLDKPGHPSSWFPGCLRSGTVCST